MSLAVIVSPHGTTTDACDATAQFGAEILVPPDSDTPEPEAFKARMHGVAPDETSAVDVDPIVTALPNPTTWPRRMVSRVVMVACTAWLAALRGEEARRLAVTPVAGTPFSTAMACAAGRMDDCCPVAT